MVSSMNFLKTLAQNRCTDFEQLRTMAQSYSEVCLPGKFRADYLRDLSEQEEKLQSW